MNNTTLFHKTISRTNSLRQDFKTTQVVSDEGQGNATARGELQDFVSKNSFSSSFPFFDSSNCKHDQNSNNFNPKDDNERAKTPGLENCKSEVFDQPTSLSPRSILKKPNTAKIGTRKQVHYNTISQVYKQPNSRQINSPTVKDMVDSSYFQK